MTGMWAGTEDGVCRPDGSRALEGLSITALARHPLEPRTLFCSADGGAFASEDAGATWRPIGLEGQTVWTILARSAGGATVLWAGLEPAAVDRMDWPGGGWETLNGLQSAPRSSEWHSPWGPADLSSIAFANGEIWVGIEVGGVYSSSDGGRTWKDRSEGLYDDVHTVVPTAKGAYAATGAGFYRSEGKGWERAQAGIDRDYVMPIVVDPADPAHLWTAGASGPPPSWRRGAEAAVFESSDAAHTWRAVASLPTEVRGAIGRKALALGPGGSHVAGTSDGRLLALDGAEWTVTARDLPPVAAVLAV